MESLVPYASGILGLLLLTSFIKLLTALSILRFGLGLEGVSFGLVTLALALVLSLVGIESKLGPNSIASIFDGSLALSGEVVAARFKPALEARADPEVSSRLMSAKRDPGKPDEKSKLEGQVQPFSILLASYVITELRDALKIGLMLIIPFIVIDLAVINILAMLGLAQLTHQALAIPLKLLLFLLIDGWSMVSFKLLGV